MEISYAYIKKCKKFNVLKDVNVLWSAGRGGGGGGRGGAPSPPWRHFGLPWTTFAPPQTFFLD